MLFLQPSEEKYLDMLKEKLDGDDKKKAENSNENDSEEKKKNFESEHNDFQSKTGPKSAYFRIL